MLEGYGNHSLDKNSAININYKLDQNQALHSRTDKNVFNLTHKLNCMIFLLQLNFSTAIIVNKIF